MMPTPNDSNKYLACYLQPGAIVKMQEEAWVVTGVTPAAVFVQNEKTVMAIIQPETIVELLAGPVAVGAAALSKYNHELRLASNQERLDKATAEVKESWEKLLTSLGINRKKEGGNTDGSAKAE